MMLKITKALCFFVTAGLIIYDVADLILAKDSSTISEVLRAWAYYTPIYPFAWGVVMGHIFWSKK